MSKKKDTINQQALPNISSEAETRFKREEFETTQVEPELTNGVVSIKNVHYNERIETDDRVTYRYTMVRNTNEKEMPTVKISNEYVVDKKRDRIYRNVRLGSKNANGQWENKLITNQNKGAYKASRKFFEIYNKNLETKEERLSSFLEAWAAVAEMTATV